jgi:cobyrinic acid a,c-diamide synthase
MMYLCSAIIDTDGTSYPMVDILKQKATMEGMRLHLGYREWNGFPGHEFHYSHIVEEDSLSTVSGDFAHARQNSSLFTLHSSLYIYKNLRASYIHLYWGEKNLFDLWND